MAGPSAHHSKILSGFDEAGSKQFAPNAIDGDSSGQWVRGADGPLRQTSAIQWRIGSKRWQKVWHAGPHALSPRAESAPGENIRVGKPGPFLTHESYSAIF